MLARVIAIATCPSVCLSRAGIVSKKKASVMISLPSGSSTILILCQISSQNSKVFLERQSQRRVGWENSAIFLALSVNISKTVADTAKVTIGD